MYILLSILHRLVNMTTFGSRSSPTSAKEYIIALEWLTVLGLSIFMMVWEYLAKLTSSMDVASDA